MWSERKIPLITIFVYVFMASFCTAGTESTEPNAADLISAVRESEMWMYNFNSFYIPTEGFLINELDEKITNLAESVTPLTLLEKYKINKKAVETHIIKSEELVERVDTSLGNEPEFDLYEYECRRNDNKVDFIFSKQRGVEFDEKGSVISCKQSDKKRVIWDGQEWSEVNYRASRTSAFFSSSDEHKGQVMASAYGGNCLDGFFWGDRQSIDVILEGSSNMKIRSQMENVNGIDCYVIDAITPNGKYTLWFDPKHGYQIAKAKSHKSGKDLYFGKPVNMDIELKAGTKVSRKQPGKIKDVLFSLEIVKFQKISDIWVPIEADYQTTTNCDDRTAIYKKHLKRTYVDLDPDFEAVNAFIPDIPEGAQVIYEDSPGIRYIWQNGKILDSNGIEVDLKTLKPSSQ